MASGGAPAAGAVAAKKKGGKGAAGTKQAKKPGGAGAKQVALMKEALAKLKEEEDRARKEEEERVQKELEAQRVAEEKVSPLPDPFAHVHPSFIHFSSYNSSRF